MNKSCYDVVTYLRDWSVGRDTTVKKAAKRETNDKCTTWESP